MAWQKEIDELKRRQSLAEQMGGEEAVAKYHAKGKLTVRERIAALADPGSFQEIGGLAGSATYEGENMVDFIPANTVIGLCNLDGRRVVVDGQDFTVRGGATDADISGKAHYTEGLAVEWLLPYVRLLDAAGGSARMYEQMGWTVLPGAPSPGSATPDLSVRLLTTVPVATAVLGSVAGWAAVAACLAHFNVMVKETSQLFVGGPPVVKAALWYDIAKEDLGGVQVQAYQSGVINNVADNEEDAFAQIKRFLSYMPSNVWELPPRIDSGDDPDRREEELLSVIPRNSKKPYDPYAILNCVLDRDSFFELTPFYGSSRITGLARADGYPVGVMINNPWKLGGSMDVAACEKVIRFVQMCDTFHLPMVYFVDEPGFMIGLDSEKQGMARAGARAMYVIGQTRMPWISFIVRQAFGVAGAIHTRTHGMVERHAWPSGKWGPMHIEGGTMAAYKREIEAMPTEEAREAKRKEIESRLNAIASPFRTAEHFGVENIIDPRDSRPLLCNFIRGAQNMLKMQMGTSPGPSYRP